MTGVGAIEQLLVQNVGAIVMAGGFIYYLIQKDKRNGKTLDEFNESLLAFNKTLRNHLCSQIKQQTAAAKASTEMAKAFQQLTDTIKGLNHFPKKV